MDRSACAGVPNYFRLTSGLGLLSTHFRHSRVWIDQVPTGGEGASAVRMTSHVLWCRMACLFTPAKRTRSVAGWRTWRRVGLILRILLRLKSLDARTPVSAFRLFVRRHGPHDPLIRLREPATLGRRGRHVRLLGRIGFRLPHLPVRSFLTLRHQESPAVYGIGLRCSQSAVCRSSAKRKRTSAAASPSGSRIVVGSRK